MSLAEEVEEEFKALMPHGCLYFLERQEKLITRLRQLEKVATCGCVGADFHADAELGALIRRMPKRSWLEREDWSEAAWSVSAGGESRYLINDNNLSSTPEEALRKALCQNDTPKAVE